MGAGFGLANAGGAMVDQLHQMLARAEFERLQRAKLAEDMRQADMQQASTMRGQDISMRGQDITSRGQDQVQGRFDTSRNDALAAAEKAAAEKAAEDAAFEQFSGTLPQHLKPVAIAKRKFGVSFSPDDVVNAPMTPEQAQALKIQGIAGETEARERIQAKYRPAPQQSRFWVVRNGQLMRIAESEYQPGDQPASNREQGRPVTSGDAGRIADLDTSLDDLNVLGRDLGTTGTSSKIGAMMPNAVTDLTGIGANAKQRQAVIDRVKQVIGKALEGGVLRKEDEYKYEKILPTIGDPPDVAERKLDGLWEAIEKRRQTTLESLGDAGFDTTKYNARPKRDRQKVGGGQQQNAGPRVGEERTINGQRAKWDGKGWLAVK